MKFVNLSTIGTFLTLLGITLTQPTDPSFFVVTAIFNPVGFLSRYELYNRFEQELTQRGIQLVTIECIFPTLGQTTFQVTTSSNPLHIQVKSDSVYWVKETLINIAARRLPAHAKWICWLDADVTFPTDVDWVSETIGMLQNYTVVQVFERSNFLSPTGAILEVHNSFGHAVINGLPTHIRPYPHPGYGWAMSLKTFKEMNGLPEFDIVGSADTHFASVLVGRDLFKGSWYKLSSSLQSVITDWRDHTLDVFNGTATEMTVGYVPVTISHFWHGTLANRRYYERTLILLRHNFSISDQMECDLTGLHRFKEPNSILEHDIISYFENRFEDSVNN